MLNSRSYSSKARARRDRSAVSAVVRSLRCERLESRYLMHGAPTEIDFTSDISDKDKHDKREHDSAQVGQPSSGSLSQDRSSTSTSQRDRPHSEVSDDIESELSSGRDRKEKQSKLLRPEGEASIDPNPGQPPGSNAPGRGGLGSVSVPPTTSNNAGTPINVIPVGSGRDVNSPLGRTAGTTTSQLPVGSSSGSTSGGLLGGGNNSRPAAAPAPTGSAPTSLGQSLTNPLQSLAGSSAIRGGSSTSGGITSPIDAQVLRDAIPTSGQVNGDNLSSASRLQSQSTSSLMNPWSASATNSQLASSLRAGPAQESTSSSTVGRSLDNRDSGNVAPRVLAGDALPRNAATRALTNNASANEATESQLLYDLRATLEHAAAKRAAQREDNAELYSPEGADSELGATTAAIAFYRASQRARNGGLVELSADDRKSRASAAPRIHATEAAVAAGDRLQSLSVVGLYREFDLAVDSAHAAYSPDAFSELAGSVARAKRLSAAAVDAALVNSVVDSSVDGSLQKVTRPDSAGVTSERSISDESVTLSRALLPLGIIVAGLVASSRQSFRTHVTSAFMFVRKKCVQFTS